MYKFVRILQSQLINIRTRPTKSALSFYVPDGMKKDLYSALLYAMSEVQGLLFKKEQEAEILNEVVLMKI
jgi:hypothetical protein